MRKHTVKCQLENEKRTEYLQYEINKFALLYIKNFLEESGLEKEEKLDLIDEMIKNMWKKNQNDNGK